MPEIFCAVAALMLLAASFVCANPIPIRGVVEGFYGLPWSHAQRLEFMSFCRQHNLNAYIYAPKDDPYHRAQWRESYPDHQLNRLKELIAAANQNQVEFIFAVSPGLDLDYSDQDFDFMINKLSTLYNIGCRRFAVFFDDITAHNGADQAAFLNRINKSFVETHHDIKPLITVPTEYFRLDMIDEKGAVKDYTRDFSAALDKNILVLYTGDAVVCPTVSDEQYNAANLICNRPLGLWFNYPVNDYLPQKPALGPVDKLPHNLPAVFFNPMSAFELSKIALATASDFAADPDHYDPQASWDNAIDDLFGDQASDMKKFAAHSQHLKNDWANCGRDDAPGLRAEFDRLLNGEDRFKAVNNILLDHINAVKALKHNLPHKILVECQAQLDQLELILDADLIAVNLLQSDNPNLRLRLKDKLSAIDQLSDKALISEQCAYRFIIDVLNRR